MARRVLVCFLISLLGLPLAQTQTVVEFNKVSFDISVSVGDSLGAFEDLGGQLNLEEVMEQPFPERFAGTEKPPGVYWVSFELVNKAIYDLQVVSIFDKTSLVDFYQLGVDGSFFQAKSGGGRPFSEINQGDGQNHIRFRLKAGEPQEFYVKFTNHTDYLPDFSMRFIDIDTWAKDQKQKHTRDFLLFGAIIVLIIYSITLSIIHKYRPYFWLALHSFGTMMYSFAARDYLVAMFLPETPELGIGTPWILMAHFALLTLAVVFLDMKEKHPRWYKFINVLRGLTLAQIVAGTTMILGYGMFVLSTLTSLFFFLVNALLMVVMVLRLWKKLTKSQKAFSSGFLFFAGALVLGVISWFLIDDLGRSVATTVSSIASLGQILIFAIALGIQMRQHEVDKNVALDKLNATLKEQNKTIELEVVDRTKEINRQKLMLEERNDRIEILFKEVHHRVKNNLQLISSLLNMQQEWSSTEDPAKAIEDSRSRVVAMSMIHQFLYRTDDISTINFEEYAIELVRKLDAIQTKRVPYKLKTRFKQDYVFDIDTSISLGLILNELVTNSYKHAVLLERDLELLVTLVPVGDGVFTLEYKDSGEEIKIPFEQAIKQGFGLRMASRLAKQLQGKLTYSYQSGNLFTITFADEEARKALTD